MKLNMCELCILEGKLTMSISHIEIREDGKKLRIDMCSKHKKDALILVDRFGTGKEKIANEIKYVDKVNKALKSLYEKTKVQ